MYGQHREVRLKKLLLAQTARAWALRGEDGGVGRGGISHRQLNIVLWLLGCRLGSKQGSVRSRNGYHPPCCRTEIRSRKPGANKQAWTTSSVPPAFADMAEHCTIETL